MTLPKTYQEFRKTLVGEKPKGNWPLGLQSLWWAAKGDWEASHNIAQDLHAKIGSWIHAHLHRTEGDDWNAAYWYGQANEPFPKQSLEVELQELVEYVLEMQED